MDVEYYTRTQKTRAHLVSGKKPLEGLARRLCVCVCVRARIMGVENGVSRPYHREYGHSWKWNKKFLQLLILCVVWWPGVLLDSSAWSWRGELSSPEDYPHAREWNSQIFWESLSPACTLPDEMYSFGWIGSFSLLENGWESARVEQ